MSKAHARIVCARPSRLGRVFKLSKTAARPNRTEPTNQHAQHSTQTAARVSTCKRARVQTCKRARKHAAVCAYSRPSIIDLGLCSRPSRGRYSRPSRGRLAAVCAYSRPSILAPWYRVHITYRIHGRVYARAYVCTFMHARGRQYFDARPCILGTLYAAKPILAAWAAAYFAAQSVPARLARFLPQSTLFRKVAGLARFLPQSTLWRKALCGTHFAGQSALRRKAPGGTKPEPDRKTHRS